jgi:hypothetical protein
MPKFRMLSLGLLAVLATSAFAVMQAGAATGGHFIAPAHSIIKSKETLGTNHRLEFVSHGLEGGIVCDVVSYTDYTSAKETETEVTVTPSYSTCHTTNGEHNVTVTTNGCHYKFTVGAGGSGTADLICPTGKAIVIKHPACEITIPPQNNIGGISYVTTVENGVHALTLDSKAQFSTQYHGGICIFTGTNHVGTLNGSATVNGFNTAGTAVSITAT